MQHVLKRCQDKDPMLWPPAVTAAFDCTIENTPHLASLAISQPAISNQGNMTSLASGNIPARLPRPMSVFAHLGLEIG